MVIVAVGALALGLTACADQDPTAAPTGQPTTTVTATGEAPTTPGEESPTAPPQTETTTAPETTTPETTSAEPTEPGAGEDEGDGLGDPMDQEAPFDMMVETQNFSVEAGEIVTDGDGTQMGSLVTVCYTNAIEGMDTAPVTLEPWSFGVYDGETMEETVFVPVATTEPGDFQEPTYEPAELAVGECQEGWVQITTGNPHLIPAYLRYERSDTGERVTFVPDVSQGTPPPIKGE